MSALGRLRADTGQPGAEDAFEKALRLNPSGVPALYAYGRLLVKGGRLGEALPFADGAFDAIGHSDVLCCLADKLGMLAECRRVARTGARMLFYVIAPATELSAADHRLAIEVGPPFVGMDSSYAEMLSASGWRLDRMDDLTAEYLASLRTMVRELERGAGTFRDVMGDVDFEEELIIRGRQVDAVDRGLLVRELYLCEAV